MYKRVSTNTTDRKEQSTSEIEPYPAIINDNIDGFLNATVSENEDNLSLEERFLRLEKENENLRKKLEIAKTVCEVTVERENKELTIKRDTLAAFLNNDQLKLLTEGRISEWSHESIIKALKFRFALSVHGYEFLRKSGYPLPSYSTVMRNIQHFKLDFGIFTDVLDLLRFKVQAMEKIDKFSVISYDEMCISEEVAYDKHSGRFSGHSTLGDNLGTSGIGQKIFLVVVRGIKNRWKQVIACHVTRKESIDADVMKTFMLECISSVEACGLRVLLLSSDLDGRNRALWSALSIQATKNGLRVNSFVYNDHDIYVIPDPCHLLKNLKAAMLRQMVYLPQAFVELEKLPTNSVDGSYVVQLWKYEIAVVGAKRLLHHLKREDIEPSNFDKMHVGAAIRFFSVKTASALETAVKLNILHKNALPTAKFILVIEKWFSLLASKTRKSSITSRNCDRHYIFLHSIIDLFQNIVFQSGWKPLNYGFVLATLSFCDVAEYLFTNGFDFILGDRFLQDGTENIFSQIRRKEGKMPNALQCLRAIKGITVSQYVSDCKRTSYINDSDEFLLDFCAKKRKRHGNGNELKNNESSSEPPTKKVNTADIRFSIKTFKIDDFSAIMRNFDANSVYYLAGSTTNSVMKHVCDNCVGFLSASNLPNNAFIKKAQCYTKSVNKGGLKNPCKQTFFLILHCEHYYNLYQDFIMRHDNRNLIKCLLENVKIDFPECCNVKNKLIKHFFNVRSYCVQDFYNNYKSRSRVYGSATMK